MQTYDALVIGSGFGGSVAALRLAEAGLRVGVLEQGRRVRDDDMLAAGHSLRQLFWAPPLGMYGFFTQRVLRHVGIVGGVGVGGGSLVYAAVLLEPKDAFFGDPAWNQLGVDWKRELRPCYATAARMFGLTDNPDRGQMDEWLEAAARELGAGASFGPVPQGVYFGRAEQTAPDPYFDGAGPPRTGCCRCGACLTGCAHNAKNSLDKNYLYLAEARGAQIVADERAIAIRPQPGRGYLVEAVNPRTPGETPRCYAARAVFVAAGVLGSVELLLRCRDDLASLPLLSARLGRDVRTNSEAIAGVLSPDPTTDLTYGTAISSHFFPDQHTHITQNRFPRGYEFMKLAMGPMVDDDRPRRRALRTLARYAARPDRALRSHLARNWHRRITALTVMQSHDHRLSLRLGRDLTTLGRRGLVSAREGSAPLRSYIPEANRAARAVAKASGGEPLNVVLESIADISVTAHILGGCAIGGDPDRGVVDSNQEVFGYPGLFVVDGSALPANPGVNPSLTITAMAERASTRAAAGLSSL